MTKDKGNSYKPLFPVVDELDQALAVYTDEQRIKMWQDAKTRTGTDPYQRTKLNWLQKTLQFLRIKKYNTSKGALLIFKYGGEMGENPEQIFYKPKSRNK